MLNWYVFIHIVNFLLGIGTLTLSFRVYVLLTYAMLAKIARFYYRSTACGEIKDCSSFTIECHCLSQDCQVIINHCAYTSLYLVLCSPHETCTHGSLPIYYWWYNVYLVGKTDRPLYLSSGNGNVNGGPGFGIWQSYPVTLIDLINFFI